MEGVESEGKVGRGVRYLVWSRRFSEADERILTNVFAFDFTLLSVILEYSTVNRVSERTGDVAYMKSAMFSPPGWSCMS